MTAPLPHQLLEEEIRAMLQRRAQDVDPQPPPWREIAQRNGAVVISLRTGNPVDPESRHGRRRYGRQWFQGGVAAVVALVVAMVGALVVQGSGPGHSDQADGPEAIDVPSAGQTDFDPARATPLFPVTDDTSNDMPPDWWLSDPTAAAEEYMRSVRLPVGKSNLVVDKAVRQSSVVVEGEPPVQTATVAWSLHADGMTEHPLSEGTVWLRNPERGARDTWLVVGMNTRTLWITDIRREGNELSFTVDRSTETETYRSDPAEVRIDGQVITRIGYRESRDITVTSPAGAVAIIELQITIDGEPWSITSTAVPAIDGATTTLPDSAPVPTTVDVRVRPTDAPTPAGGSSVVVVPENGDGELTVLPDGRRVVVSER
jgi:hypothetical protein